MHRSQPILNHQLSSDDYHQWSIYRQSLNTTLSDCIDNKLNDKSSMDNKLIIQQSIERLHTFPTLSKSYDNEFFFKNKTLTESKLNQNNMKSIKSGSSNSSIIQNCQSSDAINYICYGFPRIKPLNYSRNNKIKTISKTESDSQLAQTIINNNLSPIMNNSVIDLTKNKNLMKTSGRSASINIEIGNTTADTADTNFNYESLDKMKNWKLIERSPIIQYCNSKSINQDTLKIKSNNKFESNYHASTLAKNNEKDQTYLKNSPKLCSKAKSSNESSKPKDINHTAYMNRSESVTSRQNSNTSAQTPSTKEDATSDEVNNCHETEYLKNSELQPETEKIIKKNLFGHSSDSDYPFSTTKSNKTDKKKYPKLTVCKMYHEFDSTSTMGLLCGGARQKVRVLDNVAFKAKAGEMLALISVNEQESSTILDILSDRHCKKRTRTSTEMYLNGIRITPAEISHLVAYVRPKEFLCPKMSTRQTILFFNLLQSTSRQKTFDTKKRIDALINDLGLVDVKHTCVEKLKKSEKTKLLIAIALMLDTDILLLDQILQEMNLFDMYFILDYIRQWAKFSGKIAILTLQPASHELFSMFQSVVLLSTGRIIYHGSTSKLASYFSFADYPCPAYKSAADYYLDLITVDNLSSSAMQESNHRIESLVLLHNKKNFLNRRFSLEKPGFLPEPIERKTFAINFLVIWIRAMIFNFPYNLVQICIKLLLAVSLSFMCGFIFLKLTKTHEQEDVWDKLGFYHSLLTIFAMPLFLMEIKDVHQEKLYVTSELKMKLYRKEAYLISNLMYSIPSSSLVYIGFAFPAFFISVQKNNLFYYSFIVLAYMHTFKFLATACAWMFWDKWKSCTVFGFVFYLIINLSTTIIHFKNLNTVARVLSKFNLYAWSYQSLVHLDLHEFKTENNFNQSKNVIEKYICTNNPLVQYVNAIVAKAECGIQSHNDVIKFFNHNSIFFHWSQPVLIYLIYSFVFICFWYFGIWSIDLNNSQIHKNKSGIISNRRKNVYDSDG